MCDRRLMAQSMLAMVLSQVLEPVPEKVVVAQMAVLGVLPRLLSRQQRASSKQQQAQVRPKLNVCLAAVHAELPMNQVIVCRTHHLPLAPHRQPLLLQGGCVRARVHVLRAWHAQLRYTRSTSMR